MRMSYRPDARVSRRQLLTQVAAGVGALAAIESAHAEPPENVASSFAPTSEYTPQQVEGWRVLVHKRLPVDHPQSYADAMQLLRHQLYQVLRAVPSEALAALRKIPIWLEWNEPHHPCMVYHPDAGWLREHDMNPEKARCVEISNTQNFLSWTHEQPYMALHELSHGYHHQALGFDHPEVLAAYKAAVESKTYESVLHINGSKQRHYALTDEKEYFAELSESYFGTNDFYPFVRPELNLHDPGGYRMIHKLWGVR